MTRPAGNGELRNFETSSKSGAFRRILAGAYPMLNVLLALLAGVATIATPCTLPMLPILLGASISQRGKMRPMMIALGFVLSFCITALALNLLARTFDFDPNSLRTGAAFLLLGFGLLMIWPEPFERLSLRANRLVNATAIGNAKPGQGNFGGFMLGTTLGLLWSPCAGPVLASILTLIASSRDITQAGTLLVTYSIGAAIPMLAIAYGGQTVTTRVRMVAHVSPKLQQGFGVIIIVFAIASYFQYDTLILAWLAAFYPTGPFGL